MGNDPRTEKTKQTVDSGSVKLGDVIQSAIWLSGEETAEDRTRYEKDVCTAISLLCDGQGWLHGPVSFIEKRPGEDRVPQVPDHIQGQRVGLLVAEAEVVGLSFVVSAEAQEHEPKTEPQDIAVGGDLGDEDLRRNAQPRRRHIPAGACRLRR